jgi:hypothetical protein
MQRGNWRQVLFVGPFAVKIPRSERSQEAMCLNRWEHEMWTVWRPKFGWKHLCPVVWGDPDGHVLVMQRAIQDATQAEIRAFETAWMSEHRYPLPSAEDKPNDSGHLADERLVVCDYGYACDSEEAMQQQRAEYNAILERWPTDG